MRYDLIKQISSFSLPIQQLTVRNIKEVFHMYVQFRAQQMIICIKNN